MSGAEYAQIHGPRHRHTDSGGKVTIHEHADGHIPHMPHDHASPAESARLLEQARRIAADLMAENAELLRLMAHYYGPCFTHAECGDCERFRELARAEMDRQEAADSAGGVA